MNFQFRSTVDCPFVLLVGKKKWVKRNELEEFIGSRR